MTPLDLFERHQHVARRVAHGYFAPGMERADLEQEALIGVWEAALVWDRSRGGDFESFAGLLALRCVQETVTRARRLKHQALNGSVRSGRNEDGEECSTVEMLPAPCLFERLEHRDQVRSVVRVAGRLTALERRSLVMVVNGEPYHRDKRVDNAIQRARRKLREAIAA